MRLKMNTYTIYATETVFSQIRVQATSEQEAIENIKNGLYSSWDQMDSENFTINEIEKDNH
jgi:hypothetical protein